MKTYIWALMLLLSIQLKASAQQNGIFVTGTGGGLYLKNGASIHTDSLIIGSGNMLQTSAGNAEISLKGNFANAGTHAGNTMLQFVGNGRQQLKAGNASYHKMQINKSSDTLWLLGNAHFTDQITLSQGWLRTSKTDTLWLDGENAILAGETTGKYAQGRVATKRMVSGSSLIDLGGIGASINPNNENLGTIIAVRTAGLQAQNISYATNPNDVSQKSIDRIWHIRTENVPINPVDITFSWLADNDNGISDFLAAQVWKSSDGGATWTRVGSTTNASARSITVPTSGFSEWTVSNESNPLPVTLTQFRVTRHQKDAILHWETVSEVNFSHFEIERSSNGKDFIHIGVTKAKGTGSQYFYQDSDVCKQLNGDCGTVYYRLKPIDLDGHKDYSPIRQVYFEPMAFSLTHVYPNPFTDQLNVVVESSKSSNFTIELIDELGKTIKSKHCSTEKGHSNILVDGLEMLPSGFYFCKIISDEAIFIQRVFKQK